MKRPLAVLLPTTVVVAILAIGILSLVPAPAASQTPAVAGREALVFEPVTADPESEPVRSVGQTTMGVDAPMASPALHQSPLSPAVAAATPVASVRPTERPRAPLTARVAPAATVTGIASWYAYIPGGAAAGPALRRALGPGWRGMTVTVCRVDWPCNIHTWVIVTLSDWMAADKLIDLDSRSFAALAPLSQGIVKVEVSW